MGRQDKGAKTSAAIIGAARRLFFENGYHATSVRTVFDTAGANVGLLAYYFKEGKSEIGLIIYSDIRDTFDALMDEHEPDLSPLDRFLFSSALEMRLCLENVRYGRFYRELDDEPSVRERLRRTIIRALLSYASSDRSEAWNLMTSISLSSIKPALVGFALDNPGAVSTPDMMRYYLDQQLHYFGLSEDHGQELLDRLATYHIDVGERFTPIMVPLIS